MPEFEEQLIWASIAAPTLAIATMARIVLSRHRAARAVTAQPRAPCEPAAIESVVFVDTAAEDGPLLTVLAVFGRATRRQLVAHAFCGPAGVDQWLTSARQRGLISAVDPDSWELTDAGRRHLTHLSA